MKNKFDSLYQRIAAIEKGRKTFGSETSDLDDICFIRLQNTRKTSGKSSTHYQSYSTFCFIFCRKGRTLTHGF